MYEGGKCPNHSTPPLLRHCRDQMVSLHPGIDRQKRLYMYVFETTQNSSRVYVLKEYLEMACMYFYKIHQIVKPIDSTVLMCMCMTT